MLVFEFLYILAGARPEGCFVDDEDGGAEVFAYRGKRAAADNKIGPSMAVVGGNNDRSSTTGPSANTPYRKASISALPH